MSVINGNKTSTSFFSLVAREDKDKVIRFTMERKDKAGEDETKIAKPGSQYNKILSSLSPQKKYLLFEVFPDSFGVYLAARNLANQRKFQPVEARTPGCGLVEL